MLFRQLPKLTIVKKQIVIFFSQSNGGRLKEQQDVLLQRLAVTNEENKVAEPYISGA